MDSATRPSSGERVEEHLRSMIDNYLPAWQQLAIRLLRGEDARTGEPFRINVRLDVRHVERGNGPFGEQRQEILCRIRATAPEGNLMEPEIEHVLKEVCEVANKQDMLHGLMSEVLNSGIEIKDVLLSN